MFKAIMERMPTSAKVQVALRALGFSGDEKAAIDSLISRYAATPVGSTILGSQFQSVEGVLAFVVDRLSEDAQPIAKDIAPIGRALAVPQLRDAVTGLVVHHIAAQPEAETLFSALNKLSSLPGAPWANRDYENVPDFLSSGLFPGLSDLILRNQEASDEDLVIKGISKCPSCGFIHGI